MPAFTFRSRFREGQWRSFRKFMLEERRDASSRFQVIDAERERIGEIRLLYVKEADNEGNTYVSERRVGICIDPANSSLAKLVAAYTALGGNPFDISMFLSPDSDVGTSGKRVLTQPGGGILHPKNIKYSYDQGVQDGDPNLKKYQMSRSGGKRQTEKANEIAAIMGHGRQWISQEIRWKRTRIEELIIKLCDLREQLDDEVEQIIWATRGEGSASDTDYDSKRFTESLTAANIAYFFDSTFRVPDQDDKGRVEYDNTANSDTPGSVNIAVLGGFPELISDDDDEDNSAL